MIMGTVLFAALMVVGANLLVDVVYRLIDPRVAGLMLPSPASLSYNWHFES